MNSDFLKKLLFLSIFLGCSKISTELLNKIKIGKIYWQYIKEDDEIRLKDYLDNNDFDLDNEMNEDGETSLTLAAKCNSLNVLKLLLEQRKLNINRTNKKGQTALISSILESEDSLEREEIIDLLLDKSDTNLKYSSKDNNLLMLAIFKEDVYLIKKILKTNIDINETNLYQETALILAIKEKISEKFKVEIVETLLDHKNIDINLKDVNGRSAFIYALIDNNSKIINALIKRKDLEINMLDKKNRTAFDYLNFEDFELEIALNLIQKGAKLKDQKYFYEKARKKYLTDIINLLIESKGDINYEKDGKNLLCWSITLFNNNMYTSLKIAKYLIDQMKIDSSQIKAYIKYAEDRDSDLFKMFEIIFYKENGYKLDEESINKIIRKNFFEACLKGEVEILKLLIEHKKALNDEDKLNALISAVEEDKKEVVKLLIDNGANINFKDSNGLNLLIYAVKKRNKDTVKLLVQKGINVNDTDYLKNTALIYAINNNDKDMVDLLIRIGAEINHKDFHKRTALMYAAFKENREIIKLLIENGAYLNEQDIGGRTALIFSVLKGNKEIVKLLMKNGSNVNIKDIDGKNVLNYAVEKNCKNLLKIVLEKIENIDEKDKQGETALIKACSFGHKDMIKILIKNGANLNERRIDGTTALIFASIFGYKDIVELLVENGANVNQKDEEGRTALIEACKNGKRDIVELLFEKGANINDEDIYEIKALDQAFLSRNREIAEFLLEKGATFENQDQAKDLIEAKKAGSKEFFEMLLRKGGNLDYLDSEGLTPLMDASFNGDKDLVEFLLEKGANIEYLDNTAHTALMYAVIENNISIVELLIEKGANINHKNEWDENVLVKAALRDYKEIVELLLEKGANINEINHQGETILIKVAKDGYDQLIESFPDKNQKEINYIYKDLVKFLIEKGAKTDYKDYQEKTALAYFIIQGHKEIAKFLIKRGENINDKDKFGNTILMHAAANGDKDLIELLLKKGADANEKNNFGKTALVITKATEDYEEIVKILLKEQIKYENSIELLIYFSKMAKLDKKYIIISRSILKEILIESILLNKSLEKPNFIDENLNLKQEVAKRVEFLKMLLKIPLELLEIIVDFI